MIALATWLHAASSCVWLVSQMLGDNVGVKEARQVRWMIRMLVVSILYSGSLCAGFDG